MSEEKHIKSKKLCRTCANYRCSGWAQNTPCSQCGAYTGKPGWQMCACISVADGQECKNYKWKWGAEK